VRAIRILLVENDGAAVASVRTMLAGGGYTVTVAASLADAVRVASTGHVDLVLLDLSLPDASGLAALSGIQRAFPHKPVVVVSSDDLERVATQAVQAGAQDYLLKGRFSDAGLRRALHNAVERGDLRERLAASIAELEHQRANFLQLNQLKNDLIAVLAHDIKGPLTSIVGFAELLEEGYLEGAAATDAARTIRTNAQRLSTLANDVLALSRIEHGELEIAADRVDLVAVAKSAIELHGSERAITFSSDVTAAPVLGDADRLRQVFDNLLRNAVKYSPGGQPVDVTVTTQGDAFRVAVRDRGIGIPEDEQDRLFERFSRASNARRAKIAGSGIGLFIVKMIVDRHGGSITVQSKLGGGSTFVVTLPNMNAAGAEHPARVTVLTSDRALSQFAAYELRSRGYRVRQITMLHELANGTETAAGDVVLVDDPSLSPSAVRAIAGGSVRLVGIGKTSDGWDATLDRPFLVNDLLAAVTSDDAKTAERPVS
jgi:signal transduction histidine kinase